MWNYFLIILAIISLFVIYRSVSRAWRRVLSSLKSSSQRKFKAQFYSELKKINLQKKSLDFRFSSMEVFKDRLTQVIRLCERFEICFCLMLLEVNHFASIKEKIDKEKQETLFLIAKNRLKKILRKVDTVAQFDENSFLILLPMKYNVRNAAQIADRMQRAMIIPFLVKDNVVTVSTNIGIAIYPDDGTEVNELLQSVRDAAQLSRNLGENRYHFHEQSFQDAHHHESIITFFIQKESILDDLTIRTQTYINTDTRELEYIHLIPYIQHETLGFVELEKYPHALHASGRAFEIFENVVAHAIRQLSEWKKMYPNLQTIIIPITMNQFQDIKFIDKITQMIHDNKINSDQLIFDISAIDDTFSPSALDNLIQVLNENNLKISLSIFLFGQLPVLNIRKLPIKILKIDKQVLQDLINSNENISIIKMITRIAQESNISLMVEQIKSINEKSLLKELDCKIIYESSVDVHLNESSVILYKEKKQSMEKM